MVKKNIKNQIVPVDKESPIPKEEEKKSGFYSLTKDDIVADDNDIDIRKNAIEPPKEKSLFNTKPTKVVINMRSNNRLSDVLNSLRDHIVIGSDWIPFDYTINRITEPTGSIFINLGGPTRTVPFTPLYTKEEITKIKKDLISDWDREFNPGILRNTSKPLGGDKPKAELEDPFKAKKKELKGNKDIVVK